MSARKPQSSHASRRSACRPPAFALPTSLCAGVVAGEADALKATRKGLRAGIQWLEATTAKSLGDERHPLFVSVRSGAEKSMPGMLDTVLNVGMNPATVHGLIRSSGNPRMAFDSYRRFLKAYAEVVAGADTQPFDAALLAEMIAAEDVADEAELDPEALERLVDRFRAIGERLGDAPPLDPVDQLVESARAVYLSWESARAKTIAA